MPAMTHEAVERVRVLLIDDQVIVGEALRRMVEHEPDIELRFCADPARAVNEAVEFRPSVILQDLVMPGVDGLVLLSSFRVNPATRTTPIVVLSSKDDPRTKQEAFRLGATDYLVKFPDRLEVLARIRAHSRSFLARQQRDEAYRILHETQLELQEKNAELQRLSSLDGLTGISNRRRFDEYLEQEWLRAARDDKRLALILVDVDHFKAYNDNYGHQKGDAALQQVAFILDDELRRAADMVARYGGEEFVVVLPDTDLQGAGVIAEKLRSAVAAAQITHAFSRTAGHVTVSLGVASALSREGGTPVALIEMADEALYKAKKSGRNQCCLAEATAPGKCVT